jgi:hypothetical protein
MQAACYWVGEGPVLPKQSSAFSKKAEDMDF